MSIWRNTTKKARENAKTKSEKDRLDKFEKYLSKISYEQLAIFRAPNIYRKSDNPVINNDGSVNQNSTRNIHFAICKVYDNNNKEETGRVKNLSPGAREQYGTTTSYVVVPLEDLSDDGKKTRFENISDLSGATLAFDPRLAAMFTYPDEYSSIANMIRSQQANVFNNTYGTVNTDNEIIPIGNKYYSEITRLVLKSNPNLEMNYRALDTDTNQDNQEPEE